MRERPILFNGEMVRAILDGRKTQTRRIVKLSDGKFVCSRSRNYLTACDIKDGIGPWWHPYGGHPGEPLPQDRINEACPHGKPGDRLWVRETWGFCADGLPNDDRPIHPMHGGCLYRATEPDAVSFDESDMRWKPSIHMPRWASRINLEITDVRVERLNDISEQDAVAEGLHVGCKDGHLTKYGFKNWPWQSWQKDPRQAFRYLWGSVQTNPDDTGWNGNPWVWVIEFKRI